MTSPLLRRAKTIALICAGLALLTGCYHTRAKIFEAGQDVGLQTGRYDCADVVVTLAKRTSSPDDTIYAYEYDNGSGPMKFEARVGQLKSGLSLMQTAGRVSVPYSYSFITVDPPGSFSIWLPRANASAKAERLGVQIGYDGLAPSSAELVGPPPAAIAFLESFAAAELEVALTCKRQGA